MSESKNILQRPIEFLKGVGPSKASSLQKELGIFKFGHLLMHFPFRYVDKTQFHQIKDLSEDGATVQIKGVLRRLETQGEGRKKRLTGRVRDATGAIDLVWFRGANVLHRILKVGEEYVVYGKINNFKGRVSIPHPEMESAADTTIKEAGKLAPVYPSTDLLSRKGLDAKGIRKLTNILVHNIKPEDIPEILPDYILKKMHFPPRWEALKNIHFPTNQKDLQAAKSRLVFEELFFLQLRLLQLKKIRKNALKGHVFGSIGAYFNQFYTEKLPFELTGAQKRVLKEIRKDLGEGKQMNRLLQGDVGSGKTIVGLMTMLMALDNDFQACLMAPTEILAQQHYHSISEYVEGMGLQVAFLSGSVKGKKRQAILEDLEAGRTHIIIGTHALLEDPVQFKNLGLAITDEQHRFGVAQRARLWKKSKGVPPHILVMTATPIPRTLAMTLYGDLDVSVIDELPPGRKEIQTMHKTENNRLRIFGFMREQIALGRQIYVVYPLIKESETLDLLNLEEGHEVLSREFPLPDFQISILHGQMKPADKEFEMQRFVSGTTQIMVATTVIEVGVNVPNASVMIIENTERFGLSQLHQLRGRVGRGGEQSYCILMSSFKLTHEARSRIQTMVATNDGFQIAEADLKLRGPGNIEGTQQSGIINFRLADLVKDAKVLQLAREIARRIIEDDPRLEKEIHAPVKRYMDQYSKKVKGWGRIS